MPTYDYACSACGHRFERFEGIHDEGAKECPKCHRKKARRMLGTGAGLIFKGSGFYTTDYKGGGRRAEGAGGSKESKEGDKKEPAKEKKKEEKEHKK
ncbi:MAG TPA: zinc ribbon domain-containing protein [Planctomycetota bacterium]|nr:zinc ribbon domain-containing protein [Planctomycetota bacterium]